MVCNALSANLIKFGWINYFFDGERRGGLMVSALDSGASGPGSSPTGDIVLCSWARHLLSQYLSLSRCIRSHNRGRRT